MRTGRAGDHRTFCLPRAEAAEVEAGSNRFKRLGPFEIWLYSIGVAAFFWAFAQQHVDPEGYIGARMKTAEGRFWFGVLLVLTLSILDYICRAIFNWLRQRIRIPLSDARKDTDTRDGV